MLLLLETNLSILAKHEQFKQREIAIQPAAQMQHVDVQSAPSEIKKEKGAIGKLSERINQFIDELKGKNLTPEQQGIYDVFTRKEKVYKIQDLKDVGEYVNLEGGRRKFGAQHIIIKHYDTNIGSVTASEILQIGDIIRKGKMEFDKQARVYSIQAEDGALLKVVVGKSTKDGSDTLITFHSKNRKAPMRATRESSALQGASQKAESSATSIIASTGQEVKSPNAPSDAKPKKTTKIEDFGEVLEGARKHYASAYTDKLKQEVDVIAQPLSKYWPAPDYKKLIESGISEEAVSLDYTNRESQL